MKELRLDKYLADMGIGSRSEAGMKIKGGKVCVNGQVIKETGYKVKAGDKVTCNGRSVEYVQYEYYMLHKPAGTVTATRDACETTVMDFITSKRNDLFPVGRLDKDAEGLLLITNDGGLAHRLLSPGKHVNKTYYVRLKNAVTESDSELFAEGIVLDGEKTLPAKMEWIDSHSVYFTIQEGKFHQIKRMFAAVGNRVLYLKRLSMGTLKLDEHLKPGEFRPLTEAEKKNLCARS